MNLSAYWLIIKISATFQYFTEQRDFWELVEVINQGPEQKIYIDHA